jgi:diguanylate cyclase (GGDEF)-like protein
MQRTDVFGQRRFILILWVLMMSGFGAISLIGYHVSKQAIRDAIIGQDLPLTSSNIYSEIQKDLIRPVLISMTMAHDTFVRDWVLQGEKNVGEMARYLKEVRQQHGAFSSFFVSDRSNNYYTGDGILKRISSFEPRDAWYYRVSGMSEDYEINVDPDLANSDLLTIFINYRVFDYDGNYLGATGIGLTVDAVRQLLDQYEQRFNRKIYFVNTRGEMVEFGKQKGQGTDLRASAGIGALLPTILAEKHGSWQYEADGDSHILHVNYLPELKWYLFVEQNESVALAGVRQTLYTNLAISLFVTLVVVFIIHFAFSRYQGRIESMASTDKLTGLLNRHAFTILIDKLVAELRREPRPVALLMVDIDHFKAINDSHGHLAGDAVLERIATTLLSSLRTSDLAVRWGGEEFLLVLKGCGPDEAWRIAENLRTAVAAAEVVLPGKTLRVSISIGIAAFDHAEPPTQAIDRADSALYKAKQNGRNRVESAGRA